MRLIDTEEGAKRLARVILSDIEIYNRQQVRSQADLKPQLDEGYALFRSRVAPALVPLFSEVVADRWSGSPAKPAASVRRPTPHPPAPPEPAAPPPAAAQATRRDSLDPREAARRLARVMASSIQGCDRPDGGAGLAAEIDEARTLFHSCVLPELAPLFDDALAELGLLEDQILPPRQVTEPAPPMLVSPYESTQAVPSTINEQTDRTTAPDTLLETEAPPPPPTHVATASPEPDEDLPTIAVPPASSSRSPELVQRSPSKGWLAASAAAVAAATAGIVYLLLTGS